MGWIYLARNRDKQRAVVDAVMNLGFQKILGICLLAEQLLDSQKDSAIWN